MTGTLPSVPLTQNIDENGLPQSGCRLFLYQANTSTPVIAFKDYTMTPGSEHVWPIVGDMRGRIPMFWLPDGFYRARLEDQYGTPLYDEPQLPALSTGTGGGGVVTTTATQFLPGDFWWQPTADARIGWVRANGLTIGDDISGASEHFGDDCANLFSFLWNRFDNNLCPVIGGRGASATADFTGHKQIQTLDMRGVFGGLGVDGMGNGPAGRLIAPVNIYYGGFDAAGAIIGNNIVTLAEADIPSHTHGATTTLDIVLKDPGHSHGYAGYGAAGPGLAGGAGVAFSNNTTTPDAQSTGVFLEKTQALTTVTAKGGGGAHNNTPLSRLGTWYIRL